jgi:26S proteasome regulatory subunit N12
MPSAVPSSTTDLTSLLHSLQQALATNPSAAQDDLSQAKIALLHANALIPSPESSIATLQTARSILETGALISIRLKDPLAFVRYWSQLQPFYDYTVADYSPSKDRSKITGLYLLLLLSQGDYAAFHTLLEGLVAVEGEGKGTVVENDPFIRYPAELERSLMEGSYDQVWKETMGEGVPGEEFALFSQVRNHLFSFLSSRQTSRAWSSTKTFSFYKHFIASRTFFIRFAAKSPLAPSPRIRLCPYHQPRTFSF